MRDVDLGYADSRIVLSRWRSLRFARRMARVMNGAATRLNPSGAPRFRNVMRVASLPSGTQVYVVSIGKGPCAVRMTSPSEGENSTISQPDAPRFTSPGAATSCHEQ